MALMTGPPEIDPALVRAAQRGDQIAVADLMDALAPYVGRVCGPIALQDGPDAAQEALIAILPSAAAAVPGLAELTARELEILALLAAGIPNPRIAGELVVTLDTVKNHVSHLLGKLGGANRTEAVTSASSA
jgi:DNA-binding NarL/FixJ family response regulator